jgi:hypothetical protein
MVYRTAGKDLRKVPINDWPPFGSVGKQSDSTSPESNSISPRPTSIPPGSTPADIFYQASTLIDEGERYVRVLKCGSAKKIVEKTAALLTEGIPGIKFDRPRDRYEQNAANEIFGLVNHIKSCEDATASRRDVICESRARTRSINGAQNIADFVRKCNLELAQTSQDFQ